jgi:hypothetical protein
LTRGGFLKDRFILSKMARPRKTDIDFAAHAVRYGVSEKTCRNWHAAGADLDSLESVGDLLIKLHAPKSATLLTLEHQLTDSENE